jgi:hypothetical protein
LRADQTPGISTANHSTAKASFGEPSSDGAQLANAPCEITGLPKIRSKQNQRTSGCPLKANGGNRHGKYSIHHAEQSQALRNFVTKRAYLGKFAAIH